MNQNDINSVSMLRVGIMLHGTYRIDSYLSSGGFGNTYVATNVEFNERYAIKEFFMKGVTQRDENQTTISVSNSENVDSFLQQKEKFKKEARRLRQLNNPHIVKVYDLFEENGTAYYVMDYVDGENFSERLKRTGQPMSEEEISKILPQILDALQAVHDAGFWHLDLKPANIMVDKAGQVKLIDFGASKQLNAQKGGATTSTAISYTNGYAPREQMEQNYDKFGPWTDIYALGATLYNLLTNQRPPLPIDIDDDMSEDKHLALPMPNVSSKMKQLILWLMKTNRMQRPKGVYVVEQYLRTKQSVTEKESSHKDSSPNKDCQQETEEQTIVEPLNFSQSKEKQSAPDSSVLSNQNDDNIDFEDNKEKRKSDKAILAVFLVILLAIILMLLPKQCANKKINGFGTTEVNYSWGSGIYEGNLKESVPDGHGQIRYYDGKVFVGEFKDGVANGTGTFTNEHGTKLFEGIYVNGQRYSGTMLNDNGTSYTGGFEYGLPNGEGVLTSSKGEVLFKGTFYSGQRKNGYGVETGKNTDGQTWRYEGEYKNGIWNGKGTITWSNGDKYVGDWKDGDRTGQGVYTFNEKRNGHGYKYEGGFLNGEYHGTGTWYYVGGGSDRVKYKNGKEIR